MHDACQLHDTEIIRKVFLDIGSQLFDRLRGKFLLCPARRFPDRVMLAEIGDQCNGKAFAV